MKGIQSLTLITLTADICRKFLYWVLKKIIKSQMFGISQQNVESSKLFTENDNMECISNWIGSVTNDIWDLWPANTIIPCFLSLIAVNKPSSSSDVYLDGVGHQWIITLMSELMIIYNVSVRRLTAGHRSLYLRTTSLLGWACGDGCPPDTHSVGAWLTSRPEARQPHSTWYIPPLGHQHPLHPTLHLL